MKEVELTLSSDNKNWMDTSVISDTPKKITVIDPRPHVAILKNILASTQTIQEEDYTARELENLAGRTFHAMLTSIVSGRRAWVNGESAELAAHPNTIMAFFGSEMNPIVRDKLRYELDFDLDSLTLKSLKKMNIESMDKSLGTAVRLSHFMREVGEYVLSFMNPNQFVIHEITFSRNGKMIWLEEHEDWRVVQWTKAQQEKIDIDNANL